MLLTFITMSWILSIMFMFLSHPLSFGFILLLQTILISASSGMLNSDYWFSYILFLIMIGGMLVLFIYMTSVASNEKFKFSKNLTLFFISSMMLMSLLFMFMDDFYSTINMTNSDLINQSNNNINLSLSKFMSYPGMLMMIILMIYLLMTLIAVVKIAQSKMGPLRSTSL